MATTGGRAQGVSNDARECEGPESRSLAANRLGARAHGGRVDGAGAVRRVQAVEVERGGDGGRALGGVRGEGLLDACANTHMQWATRAER